MQDISLPLVWGLVCLFVLFLLRFILILLALCYQVFKKCAHHLSSLLIMPNLLMLLYIFQNMFTSIFNLMLTAIMGLYVILYIRKTKVKYQVTEQTHELMSPDLQAWTVFLNSSLFTSIPWKWKMQLGYYMTVIDSITEYFFWWNAFKNFMYNIFQFNTKVYNR